MKKTTIYQSTPQQKKKKEETKLGYLTLPLLGLQQIVTPRNRTQSSHSQMYHLTTRVLSMFDK